MLTMKPRVLVAATLTILLTWVPLYWIAGCSAAQQEAANAQAATVADIVNEVARKGDTVYAVSIDACHKAEMVAVDLPDVEKARAAVIEIRKRCDQAFDAVDQVRVAIARVDQLVADIERGVGNAKALADAALKARDAFADAENAQLELTKFLREFGQ